MLSGRLSCIRASCLSPASPALLYYPFSSITYDGSESPLKEDRHHMKGGGEGHLRQKNTVSISNVPHGQVIQAQDQYNLCKRVIRAHPLFLSLLTHTCTKRLHYFSVTPLTFFHCSCQRQIYLFLSLEFRTSLIFKGVIGFILCLIYQCAASDMPLALIDL